VRNRLITLWMKTASVIDFDPVAIHPKVKRGNNAAVVT